MMGRLTTGFSFSEYIQELIVFCGNVNKSPGLLTFKGDAMWTWGLHGEQGEHVDMTGKLSDILYHAYTTY